jgi:hypothetical protein
VTSSSLSKALPLRKKTTRTRHQQHQHSAPETTTGQQYPTPSYPLSIELLPQRLQWWDEDRYCLIHKATGLRIPGSWSISEALEIQESSRYWDWQVDPKSRIPNCQQQILDLCVRVCNKSNQKRSPNQQESASLFNLAEKK